MAETRKCEQPVDGAECGKRFFNNGPLTKTPCCSGHYQRERRLKARIDGGENVSEVELQGLLGNVRHYGEGSHQISTRVTTAHLGEFEAIARRRYPVRDPKGVIVGDVSALLREVVHMWLEGQAADPGEPYVAPVPGSQEHGAVDAAPQQATEHQHLQS